MSKQHYTVDSYQVRQSVGYLVKRAHGLALDVLEPAVAQQGLTFVQYVVMMALRDKLVLNAKDICTALRHDSGALTRVIDQLETRGLVQRNRSLADRRAVELRLTEAGQAMLVQVLPTVVDKTNSALGEFSDAEFAELLRLLNKLVAGLEGMVGAATAAATGAEP